MSEKKADEIVGNSQDVEFGVGNVQHARPRKTSAVDPTVIAGEIFDDRYETTQRGLKSRYVIHPISWIRTSVRRRLIDAGMLR